MPAGQIFVYDEIGGHFLYIRIFEDGVVVILNFGCNVIDDVTSIVYLSSR